MATGQEPIQDSRRRRRALAWWLGLLILGILVALFLRSCAWDKQGAARHPAPSPTPGTSIGGGSGTTMLGEPFTMSAQLDGALLVLGQSRNLRITISNPNRSAILILTITVRVVRPSPSSCSVSWFQVGVYRAGTAPALVVGPLGSTTATVPLSLVDLRSVNQNACKNAHVGVTLSGSARQLA